MPKEHAIIIYGRFQPPTAAHHMVAQKAVDLANQLGGDAIVYGSHSEGTRDNPLSTETKLEHMKTVLDVPNIVIDKNLKGLAHVLQHVHNQGYRKITLLAGADRVPGYEKFKKYFGVKTKSTSSGDILDLSGIQPEDFNVVSAGDRDPDSDPDPSDMKSISGTKMRKAAQEGDIETFKSMLPSHVSHENASKMMSDVKSGLEAVPQKKSKKLKEEVSATTRLKLAKVARRTAKKRAIIRKMRSKRRKNIPQLKKRAKNEIKDQLRRKVYHGNWKKLSYAQRATIDRMINKRKPMIDNMVKRIMPNVVRGESERLRKLNSSYDPVVTNFMSNFLLEKLVSKKVKREPLDTERKVKRRAQNRVNKRAQRDRDDNRRAVGSVKGNVMVVKSKQSGDVEIIDKESFNSKTHSVLIASDQANLSNIKNYTRNKSFKNTVTSERLFGYIKGMGDGKSDKKGKAKVEKAKSEKPKKASKEESMTPEPVQQMIPAVKKATKRDTFATSHDATSMESGIAYQVNLAMGLTPEQMISQGLLDKNTVYAVMSNNHESFAPSCIRAAQVFMKQYPGCVLKHTGRLKKEVQLTDLAKENNMMDTTPKPDLVAIQLATNQPVAGLSQKIGKDTQLGSGSPSELITNLKWSRLQLGDKLSSKEIKAMNDFVKLVESEMKGNPRTKSGPTSLYLPGGSREGEDEEVTRREQLHRKVTDSFNNIMNANPELRAYFVYASLTGAGKFQEGIGIATHIFSANRDGTDAKVTPITLDYARKISDGGKVKFQATIKSSAVETSDIRKKWNEFKAAKKRAGEKVTLEEDFRPYAFRSCLRSFLSENVDHKLNGSSLIRTLLEKESIYDAITPKEPETPEEAVQYLKDAADYIGDDATKMYQFFEDTFDISITPTLLDFNEYADNNGMMVNKIYVNGKEFNVPVEEPYDYAKDGTLKSTISESKHRNYRKEYDNYHSRPEQRKNRSKRVLARRLMMKLGKVRKGDGKDVDHKDGNPRNNGKHNLRVRDKSENRADN